MKAVLGVDIGGTSVKAGVFSLEGELLATGKTPTGEIAQSQDFERIVVFLRELLAGVGADADEVAGVGVDVPGPVDSAGHVGMLPNIVLDIEGLRGALQSAFPQAGFAILNDANAAALGEWWKGAAQGAESAVLVAIGTGVGGGVVVDGNLLAGAFGAGGEIGHISVNPAEREACGCGRCGCLEQYASASGIVRIYLQECEKRGIEPVHLDGPTDTLSVFRAHERGDEAARAAVYGMVERLGYALAQISVVLDPALYLVGGGVSGGWSLFGEALQDAYRRNCLEVSKGAAIQPATLGNDAALYGDAYLALRAAQE